MGMYRDYSFRVIGLKELQRISDHAKSSRLFSWALTGGSPQPPIALTSCSTSESSAWLTDSCDAARHTERPHWLSAEPSAPANPAAHSDAAAVALEPQLR